MFEVEPNKLKKFLRNISLAKTSKPFFDPIKIDFAEDHATIKQMDAATTVAVMVKFDKSWFGDFTPNETMVLPVADMLKILKDLFTADSTIRISLTEDGKLAIEGSKERLKLPAPDPSLVKDIPKVSEKDYGLTLPKLEPEIGYLIRCDLLKAIDVEAIGFEWKDEKLTIVAVDEKTGMEYRKELMYTKRFGEGEGSVKVDAEIIERIVKLYKTEPVWLLLKNNAPVIISSVGENYKISYAITPIVTE